MGNITDDERAEIACRQRATFRIEMDRLRRELAKVKREHKVAYASGYRDGSGHAFARLYKSSPNDSIRAFVSQLSLSATVRKPPFGLSDAQNAEVRTAVNALVQKMGWSDEWATIESLPL
jgi:hypothetical protein